jgi:hypothetical protein
MHINPVQKVCRFALEPALHLPQQAEIFNRANGLQFQSSSKVRFPLHALFC